MTNTVVLCGLLWFIEFQDCLIWFSVLMFHLSQLLISSLWSDFMPCIDYSREEFHPFLNFVFVWDSLMSFNLKLRHCLNSVFFYLPFWAMGTLLCLVKLLKLRSMNKLKKGCLPLGCSSPQAALPWICTAPMLSSVMQKSQLCCFQSPQHTGRGRGVWKVMHTSESKWGIQAWQLCLRVKVFS